MGFDTQQIEAAALELLDEMESGAADAHQLLARVRRLLGRIRATGMPVPGDLERLERRLARELASESGPADPAPD